nr:hypothetical protein GCM10020092_009110 [Actinoplanes digitatis]
MHDHLGAQLGEDTGRGARVGLDQLDVRQQARQGRRRFVRIQADDTFDARVRGKPGRNAGTEESTYPGDHDDPRRGRGHGRHHGRAFRMRRCWVQVSWPGVTPGR